MSSMRRALLAAWSACGFYTAAGLQRVGRAWAAVRGSVETVWAGPYQATTTHGNKPLR